MTWQGDMNEFRTRTSHRALRPWTDRAAGLVQRRIEDARQHAAAGNLPTAEARLSELYGSLARHVSDARANSTARHSASTRAGLDPAVHQSASGRRPTAKRPPAMRAILGRSYDARLPRSGRGRPGRSSVRRPGRAEQRSRCTVPAELGRGARGADHGTGQRRAVEFSQIAIFEAVGQILIKPEFR